MGVSHRHLHQAILFGPWWAYSYPQTPSCYRFWLGQKLMRPYFSCIIPWFKGHCFLFVQLQRWVSGCFWWAFSKAFVVFVYFGFNISDAVVACFDGVTIEQITKFMTWQVMLSYKIQEIISNFCFDISTKWRVKTNNSSFLFCCLTSYIILITSLKIALH